MFLRQLEYLTALARERHFARAAEACHVSQPTLSSGIRRLEAEFDVPIVRRGYRFEGFTPEGERVLQWAYRILAESDGLARDVGSMREGLSGRLRIGAIPTALTTLSLLTTRLCAEHPGVTVSVLSMSSAEIQRRLATFELDVGLTYIDNEPLTDVRRTLVYRERYLLLTGDAELLGRSTMRWAEAARLPLCLLTPDMQNRRIVTASFAQVGVEPIPSVETNSVSTLYSHVRDGPWSSVVPHAWLHAFGLPDGMRGIPLVEPDQTKGVGLIVLDRDPEPILARALIEVAADTDVQAILDDVLRLPAPEDASAG